MPFSKPKPVTTGFVKRTFPSILTGKPRAYGMFVPPEYNESKRKWPVILFLHGIGERGDDIELVKKHGPLKVAMMGSKFPFLVVAPQCPKPEKGEPNLKYTWKESGEDLLTILEQVKSDYRVDPDRIYLTGLSLGGFGSFYMAAQYPGRWAAVAPICGGGDASMADKYRGTPFWVFHGEKDRVVPMSRSKEMVEAMKALGVDVKFTTYPEADHDSWTKTYENDELYAWFLSHKLETKK